MNQVLLLNRSYFPIQIISAKKAIKLLFKKKAEAFGNEMEIVHFNNIKMNDFPKVVRLTEYSGIPVYAKLTKKNILKRDKNTCAYCGKEFSPRELTVDHIMPKSRGGDYSWQNLITSCVVCNNKKGNRTPEEAHMHLLFPTRMPSKGEVVREMVYTNKTGYEIWNNFLP